VRLDMSEYMERHSVSRMIGSPPGYIGYEEGGQLTERIKIRPYSVVLFDEIEKAHPEVFNALLQILDDGHLTDSKGRKVDFKNTVIIMTSNIGSSYIKDMGPLGFATDAKKDDSAKEQEMRERIEKELRNNFKPEFLNRLDEVIIFHSLNKEILAEIVEIQLKRTQKQLAEREIELKVGKGVKEFIAGHGYDSNFGARPLKRAIQKYILDPLAKELIEKGIRGSARVSITEQKGKLLIKILN